MADRKFDTNEPQRPLNPTTTVPPLQDHPTPDNPYGPFRKVPSSVDPNTTETGPTDGEAEIDKTGEERAAKPSQAQREADKGDKNKK